ncbi:MAG: SPOR domain-containing protein [Hyphomicrobiaceae bacterium]
MAKSSGAARKSSLFWRAYLVTWLGCAFIAAAYLSSALTRPTAIDRLIATPQVASVEQSRHRDQRSIEDERATKEIQVLRRTVLSLQSKLSKMEERVVANAEPMAQSASATATHNAKTDSSDQAPIPRVVPVTTSNIPGLNVVPPHDTARSHTGQTDDAQSDVVRSHLVQSQLDQPRFDQSASLQAQLGQPHASNPAVIERHQTPSVAANSRNGSISGANQISQAAPDNSNRPQAHARAHVPAESPAQAFATGEPLSASSRAAGIVQRAASNTQLADRARRKSGEPPLPQRGPTRRQLTNIKAPIGVADNTAQKIMTGSIAQSPNSTGVEQSLSQQGYSSQRRPTARYSGLDQSDPQHRSMVSNTRVVTARPSPNDYNRASASPRAAVVLSAAASIEGLRASWNQLATLHPALLGTLRPRYDAMGRGGPYRLLAGPLTDNVEADRLCTALRAHDVRCAVAAFVGNAL